MQASASPILQNERTDILDVLRGFALLGVMLDNLFGFTGWGFSGQQHMESLPTWPADGLLGMAELTFVNGKFYSLLSLLFGIGFSIILIRNEQKGINPLKIFYRRLFFLLLIGLMHLFLLWEGDILVLYALTGMLLPLFRRCSNKTLLVWSAVLLLSPILIDCVNIILNLKTGAFLENMAQKIDRQNGIPVGDGYADYLYRKGSGWNEWRNWQASGFLYRYAYIIESNRLPKVLGMFLLGFYTGRKMIYARIENHVELFKKLRRWGFIIGIPAAIACTGFELFAKHIPHPQGIGHTIMYALSVAPLCLAYTSVICLRWIRKHGNTRLKLLAPVGRMAMTNYLMQTIIAIILYYGVGFGLGGNIGPAIFIPAGIGVYGLQVIYSNWWFTRFNYGPCEWIWRQLSYWKKLPLKKTQAVIH